ncbi:RTA1 protein [Talaromyces pinophilus]|uniref:RTA1 protein n=1 Tax=Talaromyces pinophilus TaxID=128442 RepID=A0A6V8HES6_TALPI|nr:RTA1 protein [Talaromyces pinophilus]
MMAWVLYYYTPSTAAAGVFIALFGLSTVYHFYQLMRTRTWFMIPFFIGGLLETVGYIGRILSAGQAPNYSTGAYAMQSALILIAPAFFAASIYMELGRLIQMLRAENNSLVPVRWLTRTFVAGDVLSFLMQASGAGLMVRSSSNPSTGEHIILGGLFVQIIFFGFFMITTLIFQVRINKNPTPATTGLSKLWQRHLFALYVTSTLIMIRSVVRVVEYLEGYDGYLLSHEIFLYVLDALLMFVVMAFFHFYHPSEINCQIGRGEKFFQKGFEVRKIESVSTWELDNPTTTVAV